MAKIAIIFPGGGTQYVGMARYYFDNFAIAREIMQEASDTVGYDLTSLCFRGPLQELSRIEYSQVTIYTASYIAFRVFQDEVNISIDYLAGHSLGEYAALTAAGVFTFAEGVQLVKKRGMYLSIASEHRAGDMLAVSKIPASELSAIIAECAGEDQLRIAVYNSPSQHVVSGTRRKISELVKRLEGRGEVTVLNINIPAHSPLVADAASMMRNDLAAISYRPFRIPVISNVSALPYRSNEDVTDKLVQHIVSPVLWNSSIRYLSDKGVTNFIDIGPQSVLKNLIKFITPSANAYGFDSIEDARHLTTALNLKRFDALSFVKRCLMTAAGTPNRNEDHVAYSEGVIKPYQALKSIRGKLSEEGSHAGLAKAAFELTDQILTSKLLPEDKRRTLLQELVVGVDKLDQL